MPFTVLKGTDGVQFHPPLYLLSQNLDCFPLICRKSSNFYLLNVQGGTKVPGPCTPNEFFAKQLPTTPPPDGVLRHITRQLPLIWAPAARGTPNRTPYKAYEPAAIWRKPAHDARSRCAELGAAAQLARLRLYCGALRCRGSGSGPRHNQGGGLVSPAARYLAASEAWDAAQLRGWCGGKMPEQVGQDRKGRA